MAVFLALADFRPSVAPARFLAACLVPFLASVLAALDAAFLDAAFFAAFLAGGLMT